MANETEIVEVRLPLLPEGYRYTGEYREAQQGEYINPRGDVFRWQVGSESEDTHHIIEKIKWVPHIGDNFFMVASTGGVDEVHFHNSNEVFVTGLIEAGNYFKTSHLAKETAALYKVFLTGRAHE